MYQPRTGRFNAVDPVYAGLFDPQQWNRYAYVGNNATRFVDPSGKCRVEKGKDGQEHLVGCENALNVEVVGVGNAVGGGVTLADLISHSLLTHNLPTTANVDWDSILLERTFPGDLLSSFVTLFSSDSAVERLGAAVGFVPGGRQLKILKKLGIDDFAGSYDELVEQAGKLYPAKAGKIEQHHIWPK